MVNSNKFSSTAAFFDVDGTLARVNAVNHYLNLTTYNTSLLNRCWLSLQIAVKIPYYILLDHLDRHRFNQAFYKNYRNLAVTQLQKRSQIYFQERLQTHLFPEAKDCIVQHKKQGDLVILVTGSLDFIVAPIANFFKIDAILATSLQEKDGFYTGEIAGISPVGEEKARAVRNLSIQLGIDLNNSYAYGDSSSDLSMLYAVGNPVAVNPNLTLRRIANQEKWTIRCWN